MQINLELVSVIIPVYNLEAYVRECIESIQRQTYKNIEIIIVDDGSTDNTISICEEMASKDIRINFIKQNHLGVVTARGRGVKESKGKYIMFVDGDDWIEPNMAERLLENMKDVDIVCSGMFDEVEPNKVVKKVDKLKKGVSDIDYILKNMIFEENSDYLHPLSSFLWNKLYKSEIVKEVYSNLDPSITHGEDSVFLYKYLLKCKSVKILDECYYHYRFRENSASKSIDKKRLINATKIYVSLEDDFRNHKLKDRLLFQLEKWLTHYVGNAVNHDIGFSQYHGFPRFIIDTKNLYGKKIILYGAGNMGKDAYRQLLEFGYDVVLWVDKNWEFYNKEGKNIASIDDIGKVEYDVIFIAISDEEIVGEVKKELISKGIKGELLIWNKPMTVF